MKNEKVMRFYPFGAWLGAAAFIGVGIYFMVAQKINIATSIILFVIGLICFVFGSFETIEVDPAGGSIHVHRHSILKKTDFVVNRDDISTIEMDSTTHRDSDHHRSTEYRPVIKKKDGTEVPIRSVYSGNMLAVSNQCSKLRNWLNLNDPEQPQGLMQNLMGSKLELVRQGLEKQQDALTGDTDEIHETSGVHWQLVTRATGATPVSRWQSADYTLPDHFLYLAQKLHGTKDLSGGFLSGLAKTIYAQSMSLYGITEVHAPGMHNGVMYDQIDSRIDADFGGYGDSVSVLRQVLSIYAIQALEGWARKRPLKQGGSQLAVLIGPKGVFVTTLGLVQPDYLQEMTDFGVELVKSLKTGV